MMYLYSATMMNVVDLYSAKKCYTELIYIDPQNKIVLDLYSVTVCGAFKFI